MKGLETGKDKIQKICDVLRKDTLEPAKQEAREIVENAHLQASEIVEGAKQSAKAMLLNAQKEIEEKKEVFHSSLQMSCRQGIELLKQKIEEGLFARELSEIVDQEMGDPKVVASILSSFLKSMEDKGIEEDFVALIPKSISPKSISALLAAKVMERLRKESIQVGDFAGGVEIRLKAKRITIDITDRAVRELIGQYIRRDFRDLVFSV
jgi:V/A-type H+-transporting ATPase subunit E